MKIRILASVFSEGRAYDEGQIYDMEDSQASELIGLQRAIRVPAETPESKPASEPDRALEIADSAPVAERAEAKAGRRSR
jgi:hypothetical protein